MSTVMWLRPHWKDLNNHYDGNLDSSLKLINSPALSHQQFEALRTGGGYGEM